MRKKAGMLLLVALLAACGGSEKTGAGSQDSSESKAPTTTEPQAAGGFENCDYAKKFQDLSPSVSSDDMTDPAAMKKQMLDARAAMDKMVALAPGEIRNESKTLAVYYGRMVDALAKYDFDYTKIPPQEIGSVFAFAQDAGYLEAAKKVGRFFAEKCNLPDPFASIGG